MGSFAEMARTKPDKIAPKPANLDFKQSATVPPLREVPDAIRRLGEGHSRGKVVIEI